MRKNPERYCSKQQLYHCPQMRTMPEISLSLKNNDNDVKEAGDSLSVTAELEYKILSYTTLKIRPREEKL